MVILSSEQKFCVSYSKDVLCAKYHLVTMCPKENVAKMLPSEGESAACLEGFELKTIGSGNCLKL